MKILMVCLGNICRSPLAEGILKSKLPQNNFTVDSAGTSNYHIGELPDKRSIAVAYKHHIDISNQRGRLFSIDDFDKFDLIYAMDSCNYNNILSLASSPEEEAKVKLILNESHPGMNLAVPDPYYGGEKGFIEVYELLDAATDVIIKNLKQ